MRPIATYWVAWSVYVSVCLSAGHAMSPAKTAEPIEMPFRWVTRNHVLDGSQDPPRGRAFWGLSGSLKYIVSHCCGASSKKSITASAGLLQPTAFLPTGRCHINFLSWKFAPAMQPVVKIILILVPIQWPPLSWICFWKWCTVALGNVKNDNFKIVSEISTWHLKLYRFTPPSHCLMSTWNCIISPFIYFYCF